jgi:vitamin B12 transporter
MKPEESVGFDIGFDQSLVENRISFGAAYFNNDYDNLIEYVGSAGKYQNVAEVQTKGAEIEMKFIASDNVVVTLNDTYMDTLNKKTGEQLLKRPRNRVNAAINCMFLDSLNTNLIVNHSEGSQQYGGGETDAYTRVDFAFSYRLNDNFKIFGNVDNIFDIEYEEAAGFTRPRASFYAGIKIGL